MQQHINKIYLVVNNYAGHKRGAAVVDKVVLHLKRNGFEVVYSLTQYPGHATEIAKKALAGGFGLVVAVGGDGTVNEVAQGLVGTDVHMGIIPVGSGNGLARELGISMNVRKSVQTLIGGAATLLDVCSFNDQRFLCTSGIGFDARIADQMSKTASRGFLKYIQLVVLESIFYKPVNVRIKIDGQLFERLVFLITFANASQFGNNACIAPGASMTDGLIDVVVVRNFNKLWIPVFAIALFTRLVSKLPFVECFKAKQIDLELAQTSVFHFDGEPGKLNIPVRIRLDDKKIWVKTEKR